MKHARNLGNVKKIKYKDNRNQGSRINLAQKRRKYISQNLIRKYI